MNYRIREIQKCDLPAINKWRNDPELLSFLGNNFLYISEDVDNAWFENYLQNRDKSKRYAILDADNDDLVGTVQLTSIHPINHSAEFSITIGEKKYWNKGAGQVSSREIIRHGFEDLNLHRIFLTVLTKNQRAIHIYFKLGFVQEGVLRKAMYKNGSYEDLVMMSMLKEEYNKIKAQVIPEVKIENAINHIENATT